MIIWYLNFIILIETLFQEIKTFLTSFAHDPKIDLSCEKLNLPTIEMKLLLLLKLFIFISNNFFP